ncbi:ATP-binding cassette domain-containing protein [Lactiplantibacillus plantarum]|nr:ATP-binding cassette domain-containing protein [Lactiplantibacillus plantarum]MDO7795374.1 ATP-binding cassette domain-containing protein [Lactiplantibacillus plantarum]
MEASKLQGLEYESLSAIFTIKGSSQEKYIEKLIMNQYFNSIDKYKKRYKLNILYGNLTETISLFCPLLLFILTLSIHGMSVGESIYVYSLSGIYFGSISSVFSSWNTLGTIKNNMERINSILDQKVSQLPSNLGQNIETIDTLTFDHVFYKYPGQDKYALNDICFKVKKGEKVSLVGKTGSGKSTLLGLMLCLYLPTRGRILVNGIDIKKINNECYKKLIGFVPQQAFIFNKSIKDNILMNRKYPLSKIEDVCQIAAIKSDIDAMPMKFNTIIAELGRNISGGQKQRITIARALISNPQILLLDEATSSVDNVTEKEIGENLRKDRVTQINVAHRLSTIRDSDMIIAINNGHIAATGTHMELLEKSTVYSDLYKSEE